MSRWVLVRAVLVALSFLLITVTLATIPGRALNYWYLYYSPVVIAALSFGLLGALSASGGALVSIIAFFVRLDQLVQNSSVDLVRRLGGPESTLLATVKEALAGGASYAPLVVVGGAQLRVETAEDALFRALLGVVVLTTASCLVGWLVDENRRQAESFRFLAQTDALTGLANYRRLMECLSEEIARGRRFGREVAFLMVDVDTLKEVNDACGHLVGDGILQGISQLLRSNVREIDTVARYGGDEFGVVLVETGASGAVVAGERLRQAVAGYHAPLEGLETTITVSVGAAVYPTNGQTVTQMIEAADTALYQAKRDGKNAVALAAPL